MKSCARFALAAAVALAAAPAGAHQCDVLGKSPDVELSFIRQRPDVRLFCAACGDKTATRFVVTRARAAPAGAWPTHVDLTDAAGHTRRVDVTTIYVQLDPSKPGFTNVANRAVCERRHLPHTIGSAGPR